MSGQILVVDDLSLGRMILRARLSSACYHALLAADATSALAMARAHLPDLILLDNHLPDMLGVDLCKTLRSDPLTCDIPVILVTADHTRETRLQALRAGADDVLPKPLDEALLMARLRALMRRHAQQRELREQAAPALSHGMAEGAIGYSARPQVALICNASDHKSGAECCAMQVEPPLHHVALSLPEVMKLEPTDRLPDVFLLAPEVARRDGLNIVTDLASRRATRRVPVVVTLPAGMEGLAAMAFDLGAEEVLHMPLDPEEVRLRLDMLVARKQQADTLRHALGTGLDLAARDPLTGLFNRRHAMAQLREMVESGAAPFALLMIDLDYFKRVNDEFGHTAGDEVLVEVTHRMRETLRTDDLLARYGGEEFLLVLPRTGAVEARRIAARLCDRIEKAPYPLQGGKVLLKLTASIGFSVQDGPPSGPTGEAIRSIIDHADQALRRAKRSGRNRIAFRTTEAAPRATA